ncbi:hypothetical protein B0H13DRAFT_2344036 [Mycena leptocephala]|nr:hypothetical protein B0H13DRAFT_2344036 [Mycena leptocephala]
MAPSATFCRIPLSTSIDHRSPKSLVTLEWILSSGLSAHQSAVSGILTLPYGDTVCSMHMELSITASLPYDLVLGRDWLLFCRQTLPHASFTLSSGVVHPGRLASADPLPTPGLSPMDIDTRNNAVQPASAMSLWFAAVHLRPVRDRLLHL